MDAALGAPEKMAERADELTPMMSQYFELCREHDDSLVLFQVGDFYEAFCEAAERVARLCEITLTEREDSTGRYAMAGIPIDNAESYVETLLDAGYRVAIADQVEDPDEVSGVVERAVTRVLTPGTLTEDELLSSPDNNFVAALAAGDRRYGLALLDVSTGDFYATGAGEVGAIADEASRFAPAEAVVGPDVALDPERVFGPDCMVTPHEPDAFGYERAAEAVRAYFGDPERHLAARPEVRACGALLSYAEYTRGGAGGTSDEIAGEDVVDAGEPDGSEEVDGEGRSANADGDDGSANADGDGGPDAAASVGRRDRLAYLDHLTRYDPREYMLLDAVALDGLEVFERRAVRGHEGRTLVDTVDETACALGRRRLGDWLRRPLLSGRRIERRHAAVDELVVDVGTRERLHELLADVYDLERLISRVARGRANARDLRSLAATLAVVPDVRETLAGAESALLAQLHDELDPVADVREEITAAIREDPPQEVTEGGVIREGYDADLDALRETERSGEEWIDRLEAGERERTGIDSLKVGHTAVHGYYIEVTDANLDRVPDDYRRRQTLKNSERYVTPELKEREDEIVRAGERADDLEYQLFRGVRATAAGEAARIQGLADRLATLDALVSFATVAARHDYCRPTVGGDRLAIEAGRHPVVERTEDRFVPNDVDLDAETSLTVLTGPNMSGKSTYMRQVALCCVLAQAGGFVPAAAAELPVIDRLYTRVGASDDIAGGRSTFMIEMTELADILAGATEDSLVLLDEVGRGTSTADGLAIARAVTEHVHDEVGAYTLFATHHHDLTDLAERLPGARNRHFETRREDGDVAFEHRLAPGPAAASYGVEVADMAGVPDPVVDRARGLLSRGDDPDGAERDGDRPEPRAAADTDGLAATDGSDPYGHRSNGTGEDRSAGGDGDADPDSDPGPDPVRERLRELDVATMTPIEAMNALADLQNDVE